MRLVSFRSVRDARATPPPYESTQPAPTRVSTIQIVPVGIRNANRRAAASLVCQGTTRRSWLLQGDPVVSRRRSQTLALDPGQRPLDEESWAGASVGLERFSEVGAATPAEEELREIGVQLLGSVALAAGFTERDGVVSAQLEEQGPESDE